MRFEVPESSVFGTRHEARCCASLVLLTSFCDSYSSIQCYIVARPWEKVLSKARVIEIYLRGIDPACLKYNRTCEAVSAIRAAYDVQSVHVVPPMLLRVSLRVLRGHLGVVISLL